MWCIDARMLGCSGIGTYLLNLIPKIQEAHPDLKLIVSPAALGRFPFLSGYDLIFCSAPIYSVEEQIKLPLIIPKCDLFWSPHFNIPLSPTRAKRKVVTVCDVYHLAFFSSLSLLEKLYIKVVLKNAVKRADQVITISAFSQEEIVKYTRVDKNKVAVIHLGIDHRHFSDPATPELKREVQQRYQLPEKFILFVGNVKPHKNLRGLLKAFRILLEGGLQDTHLVIVGKKEGFINGDDVEKLLDEDSLLAKKVSFLGFVEDLYVPVFYQLAIMTILPSFYEGFGFPPLEAMSSGCPVIVSDVASLPEICGDGALYCNPYHPHDIALKIGRLLTDEQLRRSLVLKGLKRSQEFCWQRSAEEHLSYLSSKRTMSSSSR